MSVYELVKPVLFKIDPETIHHLSVSIGNAFSWALQSFFNFEDPRLETEIVGVKIKNPVGLAAGFDKNGLSLDLIKALGFGFMEVGSVTFRPSHGNPKPRLFRLKADEALINRLGLNNDGAKLVASRIKNSFPVGVNIAKTNDPTLIGEEAFEDFASGYEAVSAVGNFHVLNVSCPNTEDGKTFEEPSALDSLLKKLNRSNKPLLVKLSPDLDETLLKENIAVCEANSVNGYVLSNTTTKREGLTEDPVYVGSIGRGGLSGRPLYKKLPRRISFVRELVGKEKTIIGVGGIDSPERAFEVLRAGANAIELYTGLVYKGPSVAKMINKGLLSFLEQNKIESVKRIWN